MRKYKKILIVLLFLMLLISNYSLIKADETKKEVTSRVTISFRGEYIYPAPPNTIFSKPKYNIILPSTGQKSSLFSTIFGLIITGLSITLAIYKFSFKI